MNRFPDETSLFTADQRSGWLRLRTFIAVRCLILGGQAALTAVCLARGIDLPLAPLALIFFATALVNLAARAAAAPSRRLSQSEAVGMLVIDLVQLAAWLYFTGGLDNPFALVMLGPVTVGAAALSLRATAILCAVAIALFTVLAARSLPLNRPGGVMFAADAWTTYAGWVALSAGVIFVAGTARRISGEIFRMSQALSATQIALDHERRLSEIGGILAAAAHELGTPLATIKLASAELAEDLRDHAELRADADLIRSQADRCRDILRGLRPSSLHETPVLTAPVAAVVEEAALPHAERGVRIIYRLRGVSPLPGERQPELPRQPEIIQGLRNLVQNAVDFARVAVWIDIDWTVRATVVSIGDDGRGYPADMIDRIGEPFVRARDAMAERPGYEGMGLGLFIAKTLLERSGAEIRFRNGSEDPVTTRPSLPLDGAQPTGAIAEVVWRRPWPGEENPGRGRRRAGLSDS